MTALGHTGLLLSVCLILGLLGPLDVVPERIGIALGLGVWAAGCAGEMKQFRQAESLVHRALRLAPFVAGGPLLLAATSVETRLAAIAGIALASPFTARRTASSFAGAVLAWRLLWQGIPWLWIWDVELSRLVSRGVGMATGQRIDLGPTASGQSLFMVFLLHAMVSRPAGFSLSRRRIALAAATLLVFIAVIPSAASARTLVPLDTAGLFNMANEHLSPRPDRIARVMLGWSVVLFAALCAVWLCGASGDAGRQRARPDLSAARPGSVMSRGCAIALTLCLGLFLLMGRRPAGERRDGDIVLWKSPAFDMDVPAPGRFGAGRAGMFGMLPRYLALDGHRTRLHEGGITSESLRGAAVLVMPLPTSGLGPVQIAAVREFVAAGGSLLALGDHTDLLGTMGPLNELLAPWRIALRFDSAYPAVHEWRGCLEGEGIHRHSATGIGTGASLQIGGMARPLVVARSALSDAGDRNNRGRGAFLGNYGYDPGEQLSDLVLAARAFHGRGQVVVFGDTSSFQNLMLPVSYPFVADLFDDLTRPAPRSRALAALGAGLAAALLGLMSLAGSSLAPAGVAGAVIALHLVAPAADRWVGAPERPGHGARVALIDAGHLNGFSLDFWHDESIGGLIVNLQRAGYLPLVSDDGLEARRWGPETLVVVVSPAAPLTQAEAEALDSHIDAGGAVLVAAGAAQDQAVAPLLSRHGISIRPTPLGPVPIRPDLDRAALERAMKEPQFRQAWPIASDGRSCVVSLYRAFGRDVVARIEQGVNGGRLIVIGDPEFLTDRVLENERSAWPGNVELLADLLARSSGT